ncbi:MAG TPA: sodium:calcium antiporter [Candidatus Dormibacteraeota bacterium]|nr:sodium:calcium antiporter [Candidatus Dormibacteraeota bacterium]
MPQTLGLVAVSLLLMLGAAELFTNAVEWAGVRAGLGSGATASLLAALGTALPESVVPVVALIGGRPGAAAIAVGAIIGAPFLLGTLGLGITGLAGLLVGRPRLRANPQSTRRDLLTFLGIFAVVIAATVLPRPARIGVAVVAALLFVRYVRQTLRDRSGADRLPEPLHLLRPFAGRRRPGWAPLAGQLLLGVGGLVVAGQLFVVVLHSVSSGLRLPTLLLALILVPIATELPETVAGVLWVRSGDDALALGNVVGSMVFQATVPGIVGLCFTPWQLDPAALLAAGAAAVGALVALAALRPGGLRAGWCLGGGFGLYAAYAVAVLGLHV